MRRSLAVVSLCALALSGGALAGNGGLAPVEPASPNAELINDSYFWVAIFTGAIFVLVQGSLLWFIFRYRRGRRDRSEDGAQVHGNTNLELAWTVAPVLVLVAIGTFVFWKLPGIQDVPSASAQGGRLDVQVKGYRYYWNYTYPNGVIAVDKLRAPVGQNVRLEVSAPDFDVIHSWWIPALGGKFDAIPGETNETWFNANAPGIYRGQCAEFCGIQHAVMKAEVEALPQAEFDAWLEEEAARPGSRVVGPRRGDVRRRLRQVPRARRRGRHRPARSPTTSCSTTRAAIEEVVRNGRGAMPPIGTDWTDRQMDALTDFLTEGGLNGG